MLKKLKLNGSMKTCRKPVADGFGLGNIIETMADGRVVFVNKNHNTPAAVGRGKILYSISEIV